MTASSVAGCSWSLRIGVDEFRPGDAVVTG
jgi:hypothetical protein